MAATKYEFSITSDFPNGKVEANALIQEIQESNITIMLDRIDTHGGVCDIWFKNSLPAPEETTLNYLIGAHQGIPLASFDQIEVINNVKLHATNIKYLDTHRQTH